MWIPYCVPVLVLEVHDGSTRRAIILEGPLVRLGREPDVDVVLSGDATVSRRHATLHRIGTAWHVEDNGSRNGTRLNGRLLDAPQPLGPGDRVTIGQYTLVVGGDRDERDIETASAKEVQRARIQRESGLTPREIDVLRLVASGASDDAIARELFISVKTVHSHLDRLRDKTGHRRRPELIRFALELGMR